MPLRMRSLLFRLKRCFLVLLAIFLFLLFNLAYIKPVRNFILSPVWPNVWRWVDTSDILMMRNVHLPPNVVDLNCTHFIKTGIKYKDVNQKQMLQYNKATPDNPFFQNEIYAGFLPGIRYEDRVTTMHLYQVFADAMKKAHVDFFFVGGSLLGVLRHGGSVPWDTDIDLTVNGTDWKKTREALSCIEGFQLRTNWHMHWKFTFRESHFPFIDIFFFTENERYLWAMNYYTLYNIIYEKKEVIPLTTAMYEGVPVPVPKNMEHIVRIEFDVEYCYPPDTNHKSGKHYKKTLIKCSELSQVYPTQNLKF